MTTYARKQFRGDLLEEGERTRTVQLIADEIVAAQVIETFADGDSTPSVIVPTSLYKTANTGATTISDFDDGYVGQVITVHIDDANTTVDFTASSLIGNGGADWSPSSGDSMRCVLSDDGNWYCQVAGGGGGASNSFETQTVTDTDSGFTWAATGSVVADSSTDTLTWVSGAGVDIDVDAASDAIRISATVDVQAGTTTDSTLRWSGSAWVEETQFLVGSSGDWYITNTDPRFYLQDTNATSDEGNWVVNGGGDEFWIATATDAAGTTPVDYIFRASRSGTTLSEIDYQDNVVSRMVIKDYAIEDPGEYTPTGTTQTLTYSDGPAFQVDLESVTGNITITLSGGPPSGTYGQVIVKVTQDSATARTITWAGGTFRWAGGTAHPMNSTLNGFSIYTFETWDAGTSWWGAGADYS